jgi:hypothetical protein
MHWSTTIVDDRPLRRRDVLRPTRPVWDPSVAQCQLDVLSSPEVVCQAARHRREPWESSPAGVDCYDGKPADGSTRLLGAQGSLRLQEPGGVPKPREPAGSNAIAPDSIRLEPRIRRSLVHGIAPRDSLKIVVSPVRVRVSPLEEVSANRQFRGRCSSVSRSGYAPERSAKVPNEVPNPDAGAARRRESALDYRAVHALGSVPRAHQLSRELRRLLQRQTVQTAAETRARAVSGHGLLDPRDAVA